MAIIEKTMNTMQEMHRNAGWPSHWCKDEWPDVMIDRPPQEGRYSRYDKGKHDEVNVGKQSKNGHNPQRLGDVLLEPRDRK